jgi:hypothetical protein
MKPFVIKQHEKDWAELQTLRSEELKHVSGGERPPKLGTITVTPNGDGGSDGSDAS